MTGNNIRIRNMTKGDIKAACRIQEEITKKKVSKSWRLKLEAHLKKNRNECLVAIVDNIVVGFVIGEIRALEFGLEKSGWILTVGIDPDFMGKGVGKKLGLKLLSHLKKVGINQVYTAVQWDSSDLLAFFKSIGFKRSDFINLEYKR